MSFFCYSLLAGSELFRLAAALRPQGLAGGLGGGVKTKRGYKAPCGHRCAFSLGFFGQSRGSPPFLRRQGKACATPTLTVWSDSQTQTFTTWSGSAKGRGWDPPTLHDLEWFVKKDKDRTPTFLQFGAAPRKDRDQTPHPILHDLPAVPLQEADS